MAWPTKDLDDRVLISFKFPIIMTFCETWKYSETDSEKRPIQEGVTSESAAAGGSRVLLIASFIEKFS